MLATSVSLGLQPPRCVLQQRQRVTRVLAESGKGFGKSTNKTKKTGKKSSKPKQVSRAPGNTQQVPPGPSTQESPFGTAVPPTQGLNPNQPPPLEARFKEELDRREGPTDETSFEDRLAALKANSNLLAKAKTVEANKKGILSSDDAYTNPPTIFDSFRKEPDDPDKVNPLGNNKIALAIGTALLGAILIVSSVGVYVGGGGPTRGPESTLSAEEKTKLETQRDGFEATLQASPDDVAALEGAAVTYANLQDYSKAEQLLTKLTALKGDDVDSWRLLAETRSALKQPKAAVAAYAEAARLSGDDLEILKGYSGALVADGRPQDAVKTLQEVGERARSNSAAESVSEMRASPIELDLLLARVYSQWRGHTNEALSVYDKVIAENPADFRGYLAKGVLLRQEGRKGDADRAFLQARFMAPKELRAIVDRVAAPENPGM